MSAVSNEINETEYKLVLKGTQKSLSLFISNENRIM